ncbi:MAG: hypothetical protein WC822_01140 [Candidatus Paceibacterota bacterium]|jgi:hypothetical protein
MQGPACYEHRVTVWSPQGEELGGLFRLLWSETTDATTWMARRPGGESFTSDSEMDAFRWLTDPAAAPDPLQLIVEPVPAAPVKRTRKA